MGLYRESPTVDRKGIRLIFLNPDTEVGPSGGPERQRKRTRRRRRGSREEFSFLYKGPDSLEWVRPEIGTLVP